MLPLADAAVKHLWAPVRHLDGEDPTAFVLSANIHRRHMTKGQRAMAVAAILETSNGSQQEAARQAFFVSGSWSLPKGK